MMNFKQWATALCLLGILYADAQEIIGLWQVQSVFVGEEEKTPVARWTEFHESGSYTSGNGWLQNDKGKFSYKEGFLLVSTEIGIDEKAGPFRVKIIARDEMIWTRKEGEMTVKVSLKRVREKPMGPADILTGFWELTSYSEKDEKVDLEEIEQFRVIQFRWDRIYVDRSTNRKTGYWNIHGHRAELALLPHGKEDPSGWTIEGDSESLSLTRINSKKKVIMKFKKLHSMP